MGRKVGRYVSTHVCVRIFKACTSTSRYRHPVDFPQQRFLILYTVKATKHAYLARQSSTVLLPACSLKRPDIDAIRLPAILGGSALLWWLPCLPGNRWAAAVGHAIVWCAPVQSRAGAVASVRPSPPDCRTSLSLRYYGGGVAKASPKASPKVPAKARRSEGSGIAKTTRSKASRKASDWSCVAKASETAAGGLPKAPQPQAPSTRLRWPKATAVPSTPATFACRSNRNFEFGIPCDIRWKIHTHGPYVQKAARHLASRNLASLAVGVSSARHWRKAEQMAPKVTTPEGSLSITSAFARSWLRRTHRS